jgi:winged helix DNA-binding protein
MELDTKIFKRANTIFSKMLQGGKQLNRLVLKEALEKNRIKTNDLRFMLLLMRAELDGLICSGARINKQFTYTLLEERAPAGKSFHRDEAVGELVKRYFTSRGPATIQDFAWWSGLTVRDAKEGLTMNKSLFDSERIKGVEYFFKPVHVDLKKNTQLTFLLPDYDEYGISYKNRSIIFDPKNKMSNETRAIHVIIIDGKAGGVWERSRNKKEVNAFLFSSLNKTKLAAVNKATKKYSLFFV